MRNPDPDAAETGLRSIERLVANGDKQLAEFTLDYLGPGIRRFMDARQTERFRAAMVALGRDPERPCLGDAEQEPDNGVLSRGP